MISKLVIFLLVIFCSFFFNPVAAPEGSPRLAEERVVLSTDFGELVLALYPEVAPLHVAQIIKLVRLGAYNTTHFFHVRPNFSMQISGINDRLNPITPEQAETEKNIKAEFDSGLRHKLGTLSMARWHDPDSARSSFSIILNDAPHLDGKYTIWGHVESGGSVLKRILQVPRQGGKPKFRITVHRAVVIKDIDSYYAKRPPDPLVPLHNIGLEASPGEWQAKNTQTASTPPWLIYPIVVIVLLGLSGFFFYQRFSKGQLLALLMLNVLIGAFSLLIIFVPLGHSQQWLAPIIFFSLFGLFRLMSRFENK